MNHSPEHLRDEELGEALTRAQQRHVDHCPDCAHRRSAILTVQEAVRALPRTAEPPAAALALLEDPAGARRPRLWRRERRVFLSAAAAAMAAAAVALFFALRAGRDMPMNDGLAQEIALDHLHYEHKTSAAEVSGSLEHIGDYFAETLRRRPRFAPLEAATVMGAKRCRIGGEWSALVWLDRAGRWLSLFALPQDAVSSRGCLRASGVNVCGVRDPRGGSRVLAGNLPDSEMLRLIDESME